MAEVYTLGEAMARISSTVTGPLRHSSNLGLGIAGAEANVAIGLARLGVGARWLGRVGDDEFGRLITSVLRGEGVHTDALVDSEANTGLLIKERRTAGISRVLYYRSGSAGSRLTPADIDASAIEAASVLHVTGITPALSERARAAVEHALDVAREAGTAVSFDVNYRRALWSPEDAAPVLRSIASRADLVFAGVAEARLMVEGEDESALATALAALGPRHVVIKRGSDGALALVDGELRDAPVYRVTEIDPIGAGDAFTAGYLAEWVSGATPDAMLTTAAQCGAFSVTVDGDWEGLPTRDDLHLLTAIGDVHR
ncbi:sugar kinase [Naasia sp. SYSU D00057]|uniref:sugar kinase n=1 Tax=Naasia sp. SYSU D00057 TaxID=2817380 RepID=UPI001B31558B|nr:sugar kinase [Naasia sp. SYSU D00057]